MSKRARITLDLDPEPVAAEPVTAATPKAASGVAATAESGLDVKARKAPKAKTKAKPRSKPKEKPIAAVQPKPDRSKRPEMGAGAEPQIRGAADSPARPKANAERQPYVSVAPRERIRSGFEQQPAKTARPSAPPPGILNIGTVLKVAAVGLVVVGVALWLKRKP